MMDVQCSTDQFDIACISYMIYLEKNHTKTYTMQTTILRAYKASVSRSLQFPTDLVAHTFSLHRYADAFSLQQLLLTVLQGEKE